MKRALLFIFLLMFLPVVNADPSYYVITSENLNDAVPFQSTDYGFTCAAKIDNTYTHSVPSKFDEARVAEQGLTTYSEITNNANGVFANDLYVVDVGGSTYNVHLEGSSNTCLSVYGSAPRSIDITSAVSPLKGTSTGFRVRLIDSQGTGYEATSGAVYFITARYIPTVPVLISHSSYHTSGSTTVNWTQSTDGNGDPITYYYMVGTSSGASDVLSSSTTGTSSSSFTMTPPNTYYWSVRAYDGYDYSDWAAESSFGWGNTAPTAPSVTSPADNSFTRNYTINITWSQSTDADGDPITYTYQIAKDDAFTSIISQSDTAKTYSGDITIADNIDYYVRVRAYDGYGYSPWSGTIRFTKSSLNPLSCTVTTGPCSSPKAVVFRMYDYTNSHAGTFVALAYPYKVCCSDLRRSLSVSVLGTSEENNCNSLKQGRVLSLSSTYDAHAEDYDLSNYENNICLSSSAGNLTCARRNLCSADEACLASLSGDTNAHVGDCLAYPKKICCRLEYGPYVAFSGPADVQVKVGEQSTLIVTLDNPSAAPDTFTIEISAIPEKLAAWIWFNGRRYDSEKLSTTVSVEPGKSAGVAIIIFGGEAQVGGDMTISVKSAATGLSTETVKRVSINYAPEGGIFVQTPEFGWLGYIIIGILAAFLI